MLVLRMRSSWLRALARMISRSACARTFTVRVWVEDVSKMWAIDSLKGRRLDWILEWWMEWLLNWLLGRRLD